MCLRQTFFMALAIFKLTVLIPKWHLCFSNLTHTTNGLIFGKGMHACMRRVALLVQNDKKLIPSDNSNTVKVGIIFVDQPILQIVCFNSQLEFSTTYAHVYCIIVYICVFIFCHFRAKCLKINVHIWCHIWPPYFVSYYNMMMKNQAITPTDNLIPWQRLLIIGAFPYIMPLQEI